MNAAGWLCRIVSPPSLELSVSLVGKASQRAIGAEYRFDVFHVGLVIAPIAPLRILQQTQQFNPAAGIPFLLLPVRVPAY